MLLVDRGAQLPRSPLELPPPPRQSPLEQPIPSPPMTTMQAGADILMASGSPQQQIASGSSGSPQQQIASGSSGSPQHPTVKSPLQLRSAAGLSSSATDIEASEAIDVARRALQEAKEALR